MARTVSRTERVASSLATSAALVCQPGISFALGQLDLLVDGRLSAAPAIVLLLLTVGLSLDASWRQSRG